MSSSPGTLVRIERLAYDGDGLGRTPDGQTHRVPFTLPGELIELVPPEAAIGTDLPLNGSKKPTISHILEPSSDRVEPGCVHFGRCGGCQYQMLASPAQPAAKLQILNDIFTEAGLTALPGVQTWASPEPYGYRNRIRLRVAEAAGKLQWGYNQRNSRLFLPVQMCPIAAPVLWRAAQALLDLASGQPIVNHWLQTTSEAEFFCTPDGSRVQVTLFFPGKPPRNLPGLDDLARLLAGPLPELAGLGAVRLDPQSGRVLETVATAGAAGLPYPVGKELYWVTRGGFFQVNRFLLPQLVDLVCGDRHGELAWDLFAGVGLFSRVLARNFHAVTAVEAHPAAAGDLRAALAKLGPQHRAVLSPVLPFLQAASLQRDRPELVVLDPPRAGAGEQACTLLANLAPREIVYLSCDPTTLARDLRALTRLGYGVSALHLIDLFPQTYHLESLAVLHRAG